MTVILAHAEPSLARYHLPSWFHLLFCNSVLGLRIFFAISGFLITSLLLDEMERTGGLSLVGFYKRRIARIFPAFYVYIAACGLLAMSGQLVIPGYYFLSAATYTWNYGALWWPARELHLGNSDVLGHFWTLSLEEQFYVIWPVTLASMGRGRAFRIASALLLLDPMLRVASYFLFPGSRGEIIMMLHTGIDQILWGCVAAGVLRYRPKIVKSIATIPYLPFIVGFVTFGLIPLVEAHLRGSEIVFSPTITGCLISTLLIWLLNVPKGLFGKFLDWRPLVTVGIASYSLYIWQQPFTWIRSSAWPFQFPGNILCTAVAALASYTLIEGPARAFLLKAWFKPTSDRQRT